MFRARDVLFSQCPVLLRGAFLAKRIQVAAKRSVASTNFRSRSQLATEVKNNAINLGVIAFFQLNSKSTGESRLKLGGRGLF